MDFLISKLSWLLLSPDMLLLMLLLIAAVAGRMGWVRAVAALLLLITLVPVGNWGLAALEARFPANPSLPAKVDGIIVLGGMVNPHLTAEHRQPALGDTADRLVEFVRLARRFPEARLVFTGGNGSLAGAPITEAEAARQTLDALGFDTGRVTFEDRSRNTAENAALSKELVRPAAGETWVLVTSAAHMPRSVGTFRAAGWPVVAWPADYTTPQAWQPSLLDRLSALRRLSYELYGLTWYRLTGKSDTLLPSP